MNKQSTATVETHRYSRNYNTVEAQPWIMRTNTLNKQAVRNKVKIHIQWVRQCCTPETQYFKRWYRYLSLTPTQENATLTIQELQAVSRFWKNTLETYRWRTTSGSSSYEYSSSVAYNCTSVTFFYKGIRANTSVPGENSLLLASML